MDLKEKLAILADAAKYDASCASSGTQKRQARKGKGMGSTTGTGICHSYAPDGRCISLLKILMTNFCVYDCLYCVNRVSSNVPRARFTVDEVVALTLDFYKRNYIEGLFLSSGIIQSADYTMEQLVLVAKILRKQHDFRGYIHLKTIPDANQQLLEQAGRYADRLSINVELPAEQSLRQLAPEKNAVTIRHSMHQVKQHIDESQESRKRSKQVVSTALSQRTKPTKLKYSPAGQSTQMIVGADQSTDARILDLSGKLYSRYRMRRVYYSAFSPIPDASKNLPPIAPPLVREHRLYQADWLLRFYGYKVHEIVENQSGQNQMLDLEVDPKMAWALRHRDFFPVNINRASKEVLLRVPGIGTIGANKIIKARQFGALRFADLAKMRLSIKKLSPFIEALDYLPDQAEIESNELRRQFAEPPEPVQLSLF